MLLFGLLLATSSLALASDPRPLQDFCVADQNSKVFLNGVVCKDPKLVQADDFIFKGLQRMGNTTNNVGSNVTAVTVVQLPGLNTLGISMARIDFDPWGINTPHTHPRATEILNVIEGSLLKFKATFLHRASDFLRNYFATLVDLMISDKSHFSQCVQLTRPDHGDLHFKCSTYAPLLQHLKVLDENCLGSLRRAYCSSLNLLLRHEVLEFVKELPAITKTLQMPPAGLEASTSSNQYVNNADTCMVSEAFAKMLAIYIPLLVDEVSLPLQMQCLDQTLASQQIFLLRHFKSRKNSYSDPIYILKCLFL